MTNRLYVLLILAVSPCFFSANAWAALPSRYEFTFLPEVGYTGGIFHPQEINNAGQILWTGGTQESFLWKNGKNIALGGIASGLNNSGQIAGSIDGHAVIWNGLMPTELQSLTAGGHSQAVAINDTGQAIGFSDSPSGRVPVFWNGATPTELSPAGEVMAINNHGQIVGDADLGTEFDPIYHAVMWEGSSFIDLSTLPGDHPISVSRSMNDAGQVVGFAFSWDYGGHGAFIWHDGVMTPLDGEQTGTDALDINNQGQIVGQSGAPFAPEVDQLAVIWDGGKMYDLNKYIDPYFVEEGWQLMLATSINDKGQIIGFAQNYGGSKWGTFLLTPIPEPATYTMLMAGLGLIAFAARRRKLPSPKLVRHARFQLISC